MNLLKRIHIKANQMKLYRDMEKEYNTGDLTKAAEYADKLKEQIEADNFLASEDLVNAYFVLGNVYSENDEYPLAEECYLKALEAVGKENLKYSDILNNLGILYHYMGGYGKAEEALKKSLKILNKFRNNEKLSAVYNNLGLVYQDLKRLDEAKESYKTAIEYDLKGISKGYKISGAMNNLGRLFIDENNYDHAEKVLLKLLEILSKYKFDVYLNLKIPALNNLGELYYTMGNFIRAEECYKKFVELSIGYLGEESEKVIEALNILQSIKNQK